MRVRTAGFTLVELIIGIALGGGVAALIGMTLVRQQRFHSAATEMLDVRSQLRDAADVLAADIRGAAVSPHGLPVMTDSAIEMLTTIATSVACTDPVGATVGLPPRTIASGTTLTSILLTPDSGDVAMVYGFPGGIPDSGRWETLAVSAFASRALATACPESSGFTTAADAGPGFVVTFAAPPSAAVRKGAPIHFLRRARWSLYRSSDNRWYLGYRRCNAIGPPGCAAVQPVSGPYRRYSGSSEVTGLSFRYYDATGGELAAGSASDAVARVDIVLRGETAKAVSLAGDARSTYRDSAIVSVSPRNRKR